MEKGVQLSIDPGVLKRLLYLKIVAEGNAGWAFRELIDYIVEMLEERLALILNEAVELYGLETSILDKDGCEVFPEEKLCKDILVVGVYEKDRENPLIYAGYLILRSENTLEVKFVKAIDAATKEPI
ncbi:MAG: hypothetical protein QXY82_02165 [Desulfurococcaceae archaeon]